MWKHEMYVTEKLREIERTRLRSAQLPAPLDAPRPRRRVLGPIARATGRRVRRLGEALESWATPHPAAR